MIGRRLVYGVGINDSEYSVVKHENTEFGRRIIWRCPYYRVWNSMLERCYSEKVHARNPTYTECRVVTEWIIFSNFREWMRSQDWKGKQLDKDILFVGNKEYGPSTCIFIDQALNKFLEDSAATRGEHPLGVTWHPFSNRFHARCCNPFSGKYDSLGYFLYPQDAHEAWRKRKHQIACMYSDMQSDPRIAKALRDRYAYQKEGS